MMFKLTGAPTILFLISSVASAKMNVLLIVADDLNKEMSVYNKNYMVTPGIQSLADDGITFDNAYSQISVCGPSRFSFLTSQFPLKNKLLTFVTPPSLDSLPIAAYFQKMNYHTVGIGKIFQQNIYKNQDVQTANNIMRSYFDTEILVE